jgi:selenocysteine lyase/cysteine desulfurase
VVTPMAAEVSAGIVCVEVDGVPPGDAVRHLRERGIVASATPYATSYLRLGPSLVTTPEQVDAAIEAVSSLASA